MKVEEEGQRSALRWIWTGKEDMRLRIKGGKDFFLTLSRDRKVEGSPKRGQEAPQSRRGSADGPANGQHEARMFSTPATTLGTFLLVLPHSEDNG